MFGFSKKIGVEPKDCCCLPRKIQNFDKQNPKFQQPVETVENFKKIVQLKQNKLI